MSFQINRFRVKMARNREIVSDYLENHDTKLFFSMTLLINEEQRTPFDLKVIRCKVKGNRKMFSVYLENLFPNKHQALY